MTANDLTRIARALQTEVAKTEDVGLTYLVGEAREAIRIAPDPDRLALYGVTLQQLAGKVAQANRTLNTGKLRDQGEMVDLVAGRDDDGAGRGGEPADHDAGWAAGLCGGCGRGAVSCPTRRTISCRHLAKDADGVVQRAACRDAGRGQAGGGQCGGGGRRGAAPGARRWKGG